MFASAERHVTLGALIVRRSHRTPGKLHHRTLLQASDPGRFVCDTLELPYRNEQNSISCIKPGAYSGFVRTEPTVDGRALGWRIQINWTRQLAVQIHVGNSIDNSPGCVLVGSAEPPCTLRAGSSGSARDIIKSLYGEANSRKIELTVE